jgi:hypothetical protein
LGNGVKNRSLRDIGEQIPLRVSDPDPASGLAPSAIFFIPSPAHQRIVKSLHRTSGVERTNNYINYFYMTSI